MLLIVKLDQGVRNGFFSENLACFVLKNNRRTDLHVYFCIRCFLYFWSCWNYVFSTSFFLSANVYAKCFILLFIASFALLRCQLFFFRNLTGHSFPAFFFRKSIATISLFTFFLISFFAWRCFRTRSRVFSRHFFASSLFRSSTLT